MTSGVWNFMTIEQPLLPPVDNAVMTVAYITMCSSNYPAAVVSAARHALSLA